MKMLKGVTCSVCGKQVTCSGTGEASTFSKCIRCGRIYCTDCWQPDFAEICPKCGGMCR